MKTNVSQTSIQAFHDPEVQASIGNQRERVAARIVAETKAGRLSCIGSLWEYFCKQGDKALSQKSSVSRACNEIAEAGTIEVNGLKYKMKEVDPKKFNGRLAKHFCLVLMKEPAPESGTQIELF